MTRYFSALFLPWISVCHCLRVQNPMAAVSVSNNLCGYVSIFPANRAQSVNRNNAQNSNCISPRFLRALQANDQFMPNIRLMSQKAVVKSGILHKNPAVSQNLRRGTQKQRTTTLRASVLSQGSSPNLRKSTVWELILPTDGRLLLRAAVCFAIVLIR